jgi:hypothetical protein
MSIHHLFFGGGESAYFIFPAPMILFAVVKNILLACGVTTLKCGGEMWG